VKKAFFKSELNQFSHSFLSGTNANYIENLYDSWLQDPNSVPASWNAYFHNDARELKLEESFCLPDQVNGTSNLASMAQKQDETIRIQMMILAFRNYGHLKASIDPLNLDRKLY
jgi:2-oxoglutarate dehydrogenase E1 component